MPEPRRLLDVAIVGLLGMMLVDGLPDYLPGIPTASRWLDPVVDVTGLEQTSWKLFAPDPDHINTWVEAVVTWEDGSTSTWTTPSWRHRTLLQKLMHARWHKAADNLRLDSWRRLRPQLAEYAARQAVPPTPGLAPVHVEIFRHWWLVPPPGRREAARRRFGRLPPLREDFPGTKSIHDKDLRPRARGVQPGGVREEPAP
ncbi:MAG: hypothetical protein H6732_13770 [Alphaproteobacteria bacterium]|nr:hypothetical protein [Alphaproteobacteria bacterium]